jgi:hypothetical protein
MRKRTTPPLDVEVQRVVDMLMARVQGEHAVSELRTRCAAAAECRRSGTVLSLQALAREALDVAYERRSSPPRPNERCRGFRPRRSSTGASSRDSRNFRYASVRLWTWTFSASSTDVYRGVMVLLEVWSCGVRTCAREDRCGGTNV